MSTTPDDTRASGSGVRSLRRSFAYLKPYWRIIILCILLMVAYAAFSGARVGMVALLLDGVIVPRDPGKSSGKLVRFYENHVAWLVPVNLQVAVSYPKAYHAVRFHLESGTLVREPKWNGDTWDVRIENGQITGLIPDDNIDGKSDLAPGESHAHSFNLCEIRLFRRADDKPSIVPPCDLGEAEVVVHTGQVNSAEDLQGVLRGFAFVSVLLSLGMAATHYGKGMLAQRVILRSAARVRQDLFRRLSEQSVDYFSHRHSGDLLSRLTNDVGSVQLSMRYIFTDILQQPLLIGTALVWAFVASWQLTLVALLFLPLLVWPVLRSAPKVKKHSRGSLAKMGELTQTMTELLSGIRVVKAFGMEQAQWAEFDRHNEGFIRSSLRMVRAKITSRTLLEGLYNLMAALLLVVGASMLAGAWIDMRLSDFAGFLVAISMMYRPLKALAKAYNTIHESLAGVERVIEVLDEKPTVQDRPGAVAFAPLAERVAFLDVSFRYGEDLPWVLRHVHLDVKRGETIALVGASGAGKSTMLDLLARFTDPVEGHIALDGIDLRDGTRASLLRQIAVVGQEPFLFHTTVGENIRHGRPAASHEEIEAAARAAAVHDEILALPQGYATVLGDRGQGLSGGQRQRLTIARAILKAAPILILDEATSSLDTESERKVQAALHNLMEGRTTFVIAHRLSTVRFADRILVLDKGRIVEQGSHEELVARGGVYAHLLELQESPIA